MRGRGSVPCPRRQDPHKVAGVSHEVQAVVALEQGKPVSLETIVVPSPGPARRWSGYRRAGSAIPTSTTRKAA